MMITRINELENRWALIQEFLSNAGTSLEGFRYFNKRGKEVLDNHLHTILLYDTTEIIGYAHLDSCNAGKIWLGICLLHNKTGHGLGKILMTNLLEYADNHKIEEIRLSVDIANPRGKNLYEQFGFVVYNKTERMYFMKRRKHV